MRTHGTLIRWNDERGFGFIEPAGAAEELFVHVSSFPRDGVRPAVGELVSFDIELRGDGRKQAVRVMRPGSAGHRHRTRRSHHLSDAHHASARSRRKPFAEIIGCLAIVALGVYVYSLFNAKHSLPSAPVASEDRQALVALKPNFACDGRTMCSQMTSCAEATYFLQHCPAVKMDGDGDGVPCERQWCDATSDADASGN